MTHDASMSWVGKVAVMVPPKSCLVADMAVSLNDDDDDRQERDAAERQSTGSTYWEHGKLKYPSLDGPEHHARARARVTDAFNAYRVVGLLSTTTASPSPSHLPSRPYILPLTLVFFYATRAHHGVRRAAVHDGGTQRPLW